MDRPRVCSCRDSTTSFGPSQSASVQPGCSGTTTTKSETVGRASGPVPDLGVVSREGTVSGASSRDVIPRGKSSCVPSAWAATPSSTSLLRKS